MAKRTVSSSLYRKIYEQHYGPIPKEPDGRTYDIHHLDFDHTNNEPKNLKAITVKEHYDIHYSNGDYQACLRIGQRMALDHNQLSELATLNNMKRVANGTHPFLGDDSPCKKKLKDGTHNFLINHPGKNRLLEGSHNFLTNHPNSIVKVCPHCGKSGGGRIMKRWHFENCKMKKNGN